MQSVARLFYDSITSHPMWLRSRQEGLLSVPLAADWEDRPLLSHISTIWTRPGHMYWLYFHLLSAGYCVWPIEHPVVPVGQARIKISLHAGNTDQQLVGLVEAIFVWVGEILSIEAGRTQEKVTKAARDVYAWMRSEGLDGFGMA